MQPQPDPILDVDASVVLDASGRGVVVIQTETPRQLWQVNNVAVSGTSALDVDAKVYFGSETPKNYVGGTNQGNNDNIPCNVLMYPNKVLTIVWSGGTPGARQTASLIGTYKVAR